MEHAHTLKHRHIHMPTLTHSLTHTHSITPWTLGSEAADPHSTDITPVTHSDTEGLSCQFNSAVCVSVCLCVILQIVLPHTDKKNDGYKNWQWFHCVFLNHIISHCPNVSYPCEIWVRALKKKFARWIIGQVRQPMSTFLKCVHKIEVWMRWPIHHSIVDLGPVLDT